MSPSLAVDADLTLTHDDDEISVWDDGETLVVDAPSYSAAVALLRTVTTSPRPPAELFRGVNVSGRPDESGTDGGEDAGGDAHGTADSDANRYPPHDAEVEPATDPDALLERYGLTVEVRVRYATVARLGAGAAGGRWRRRLAGRVLGVPAAVRLRGVVVAALRRVG